VSRKVCATSPHCPCGGDTCACVEGYPPNRCTRCGSRLRDPAEPALGAETRAWVEHLTDKPKT
jgi:hypothetical protein